MSGSRSASSLVIIPVPFVAAPANPLLQTRPMSRSLDLVFSNKLRILAAFLAVGSIITESMMYFSNSNRLGFELPNPAQFAYLPAILLTTSLTLIALPDLKSMFTGDFKISLPAGSSVVSLCAALSIHIYHALGNIIQPSLMAAPLFEAGLIALPITRALKLSHNNQLRLTDVAVLGAGALLATAATGTAIASVVAESRLDTENIIYYSQQSSSLIRVSLSALLLNILTHEIRTHGCSMQALRHLPLYVALSASLMMISSAVYSNKPFTIDNATISFTTLALGIAGLALLEYHMAKPSLSAETAERAPLRINAHGTGRADSYVTLEEHRESARLLSRPPNVDRHATHARASYLSIGEAPSLT